MLDQLVGAFLVVALLVPEVVFFTMILLFLRVAVVAFFVLPLVARVVVFFAFVDDLPFVVGVWGSSEESSVVVTFLRVTLRAVVPFCSGLSPAICC